MPRFLKVAETRNMLEKSDTYIDLEHINTISINASGTITLLVAGAYYMIKEENPLYQSVKASLQDHAGLSLPVPKEH